MTSITTRAVEIAQGFQSLTIEANDWAHKLTAPRDVAAELVDRIAAGETEAEVTPTVAGHVLHHYGFTGGMEPGAFTKHLIEALVRADRQHWLRLYTVYPAYAQAVHWAANTEDGTRRLQDLAKQRLVTPQDGA
ncbi:hypothetical protein DQ384_36425 [Sphaerisporangium album]|uniref:Uncharacterized protein n=1 Tax=Sphaerisporangium album TaxID=509200 RepID=A0A367EV03_9ACTN|nr:hypothetical protein [Sphaerisporangium album]RCG21948.1 hypothetical protein DQ384_36425 [Sphaerisporangium album]